MTQNKQNKDDATGVKGAPLARLPARARRFAVGRWSSGHAVHSEAT
jgi:hypothetical protein